MQSAQMHILVATRHRAVISGPQSYVLGLFQSWQPAVTSRGSSTSRVKLAACGHEPGLLDEQTAQSRKE